MQDVRGGDDKDLAVRRGRCGARRRAHLEAPKLPAARCVEGNHLAEPRGDENGAARCRDATARRATALTFGRERYGPGLATARRERTHDAVRVIDEDAAPVDERRHRRPDIALAGRLDDARPPRGIAGGAAEADIPRGIRRVAAGLRPVGHRNGAADRGCAAGHFVGGLRQDGAAIARQNLLFLAEGIDPAQRAAAACESGKEDEGQTGRKGESHHAVVRTAGLLRRNLCWSWGGRSRRRRCRRG